MWFARSALLALSALSFAACGSDGPADLSDTEQAADGCGAYRYRGSGSVFCSYEGELKGTVTAQNVVGVCLNDSQIECSFNDLRCEWSTPSSATNCVGTTGNLCANYPPEASLWNPGKYVYSLSSGNTLCDPPPPAAQLATVCKNLWENWSDTRAWAHRQCDEQTSTNSGGVTCCLDCANPTPLPQLEPGDECAGGDCGCPLEEEPGDGSGSGSGAGPGSGSSAP